MRHSASRSGSAAYEIHVFIAGYLRYANCSKETTKAIHGKCACATNQTYREIGFASKGFCAWYFTQMSKVIDARDYEQPR